MGYIHGQDHEWQRLTQVMMQICTGNILTGLKQDIISLHPFHTQINSSYELSGLDDSIGDVVKIANVGTGGWLLLQKKDNQDTSDYTVNYDTIGRQNGTIEFLNSLYDTSSENIAYDGASFDKIFYDTEPVEEFRIVINTIKNKLFIDDLQINGTNYFLQV